MAVTIRDIANKSGVSMATVSRVINHSGPVSQKTRKAVEDVIAEMSFIPNAVAQTLSIRKSNVIGALIPEIDNPFFSGIIHGINEICDRRAMNLMLFSTNTSADRETRYIKAMTQQRVCGMIAASSVEASSQTQEYADMFDNFGSPVVLVDRGIINTHLDGVFTDDARSMTELVGLLIKNGHRHIEYLAGQMTSVGRQRLKGYQEAFAHYRLPYEESWIHYSGFTTPDGYEIMRRILSRDRANWPTAIVASNNSLSIGVLRALSELNLSIPDDIAFCAYDQLDILEYMRYSLTLIEKDNIEIGRTAAKMLLDRIDGIAPEQKQTVIVQPRLVVRGSERFPRNRLQAL